MVQTLGKKIDDSDLFDDTAGYDDETGVEFATGLTPEEQKQAVSLYRLFNGLWGVCIIKGQPGTGKDLFGNYLQWKLKRFFPRKRILRDERPREIFGKYTGLFNEQIIHDDLKKMRDIAKGAGKVNLSEAMEKAADDWVKGAGEVLLKNSVLYLTEYWRYCYNREPHNPMNKTMGAIQKTKRHLDCLVIGTTQLVEELDKRTSKPWIDWQATCTRSSRRRFGFTYFVQRVKYDRRVDVLVPIGRTFPISFDAGKPRTLVGDGRMIIRKPDYRPVTDEERIVLDVMKAGVYNYEELVAILGTQGDMEEWEVLDTVKELSFNLRKRAIDYPCYLRLFNSKSAPQLETSLGVDEDAKRRQLK